MNEEMQNEKRRDGKKQLEDENVLAGKTEGMIREQLIAYKSERKQGEYTLEDYYALPDERRVELIDGVIYDMAAPTHIHQLISGQIFRTLADYIDRSNGTCIPAYAPLDVQLDCDDKTMLQPDVLVVCDRSKFRKGIVYGAPDLVVEILSPSTRNKDSYLKTEKYANAGVREYWQVDPEKRKVLVYDYEHDEWPVLYSFEDTVPVRIYGGDCKVDFAEIYEYVKFLYE